MGFACLLWLGGAAGLHAADYYWLASPLNANWSTSGGDKNWSGHPSEKWNNGHTANFANPSSITNINLTMAISAAGLNFSQSGYTINAGVNVLTVGTGGITASASSSISNGTLNLSGAQTWDVATAQTLAVSSIIGSSGNLTKSGNGTLTLSGNNTYSGTTTVTAGTLQVGSGGVGRTGTGAVSVDVNSTILGTGTIQGSSFTLANGATLRAGDSAASTSHGTLVFTPATLNNVNLQGNVILDITSATNASTVDPSFGGNAVGSLGYIAYVSNASRSTGTGSGAHDLLVFNNPLLSFTNFLTVTGNMQVVGSPSFTAAKGQIFNLLDWSNLISMNFLGFDVGTNYRTGASGNEGDLDLPTLSGGLLWDVSQFTTQGVIVVVPEPSRAVLVIASLLVLSMRRHR
jgi:autotransporter-associated beta strand protein